VGAGPHLGSPSSRAGRQLARIDGISSARDDRGLGCAGHADLDTVTDCHIESSPLGGKSATDSELAVAGR
jgi:hypothetical protein